MSRREFSPKVKTDAFTRAKGRCEECTARLFVGKFAYDHRIADAMGGEPTLDNCQVLCTACHGVKTSTIDTPGAAKVKRVKAKHVGAAKKRSTFACARTGKYKQKIGGRTELR